MNRSAATFAVLLALTLFGCASNDPRTTKSSGAKSETYEQLKEEVIKVLVEDDARHMPGDSETYSLKVLFLTIDRKDPPESLLNSFSHLSKPVLPGSMAKGDTTGVYNKKTGERGVALSYENFSWRNDHDVTVTYRWFIAGLSAGGGKLRLERHNGEWQIVRRVNEWES